MVLGSKKNNLKSTYLPFLVILLSIVFISWIVYWATGANPTGNFHPVGVLELFTAPIQGFIKLANMICFLCVVGGFSSIVIKSKSLEALFSKLSVKLQNKKIILICVFTTLFAMLGTFLGMTVIAIPFYGFLIPILLSLGISSSITFLIVCFGTGIGALASTINPIIINNAFDAANRGIQETNLTNELSYGLGITWRFVSFAILVLITIFFIIYKFKTSNVINESFNKESFKKQTIIMSKEKTLTLIVFFISILIIVFGSIPWDSITGLNGFQWLGTQLARWFPYLAGQSVINGEVVSNIGNIGTWSTIEMSFVFLIGCVVMSFISSKSNKVLFNEFIDGIKSYIPVILIAVVATSVGVMLEESGIQSWLVDILKNMNISISPYLTCLITFVVMTMISFMIPSRIAFVNTVMPVTGAALSSEVAANGVGYTVSGSVLTASFANGFINLTTVVSTSLVIGLDVCKINLKDFYKSCWLYILILFFSMLSLLMIGVSLPQGSNIF